MLSLHRVTWQLFDSSREHYVEGSKRTARRYLTSTVQKYVPNQNRSRFLLITAAWVQVKMDVPSQQSTPHGSQQTSIYRVECVFVYVCVYQSVDVFRLVYKCTYFIGVATKDGLDERRLWKKIKQNGGMKKAYKCIYTIRLFHRLSCVFITNHETMHDGCHWARWTKLEGKLIYSNLCKRSSRDFEEWSHADHTEN